MRQISVPFRYHFQPKTFLQHYPSSWGWYRSRGHLHRQGRTLPRCLSWRYPSPTTLSLSLPPLLFREFLGQLQWMFTDLTNECQPWLQIPRAEILGLVVVGFLVHLVFGPVIGFVEFYPWVCSFEICGTLDQGHLTDLMDMDLRVCRDWVSVSRDASWRCGDWFRGSSVAGWNTFSRQTIWCGSSRSNWRVMIHFDFRYVVLFYENLVVAVCLCK